MCAGSEVASELEAGTEKALTGQPPAFRDSGAYDAVTTVILAAILPRSRTISPIHQW